MARISHRPYLDRLSMPWGREVTNLLEEHARLIQMLRDSLVATSRKGTSTRQQVQQQANQPASGGGGGGGGGATALAGLSDVSMAAAAGGKVLTWDEALGRAWWQTLPGPSHSFGFGNPAASNASNGLFSSRSTSIFAVGASLRLTAVDFRPRVVGTYTLSLNGTVLSTRSIPTAELTYRFGSLNALLSDGQTYTLQITGPSGSVYYVGSLAQESTIPLSSGPITFTQTGWAEFAGAYIPALGFVVEIA